MQAMMPCFETYYGNPSSLHTLGQNQNEILQDARARVAKCLGCEPREIYFTSGGSEADNQAIVSAARLGERKNKKHTLASVLKLHLYEVARIVIAGDVGKVVVRIQLFILSAATFRTESAQAGVYHKFFVHISFSEIYFIEMLQKGLMF
mgnify:CR=1 FL=1